jgi:hypothetical protein
MSDDILELKGESMRKTRRIIEKADQNQKDTDKEAVV